MFIWEWLRERKTPPNDFNDYTRIKSYDSWLLDSCFINKYQIYFDEIITEIDDETYRKIVRVNLCRGKITRMCAMI